MGEEPEETQPMTTWTARSEATNRRRRDLWANAVVATIEGIIAILLMLAFAAGVVAIFVGIWTDWRWSATGALTCLTTTVIAWIWNELTP